MQVITSQANPQIKNVIALCRKARERSAQGLFVVEGIKMFREAPREAVAQVLLAEHFLKSPAYRENEAQLAAFSNQTLLVSDRVFGAMSDTQTPQGILCLVRGQSCRREALFGPGTPLVMVLENVQDPGNLGTMLRTGEGAGVTGFFLSPDCVDIYNPKVIRSTMGSIYRMPFVYAEDREDFYETLGSWRSGKGAREKNGPGRNAAGPAGPLRLFAAHLRGENAYDREDYRGPSGFLIGNESKGLTGEAAALADTLIRIPMGGRVESLNAAMAGGILMYEAARQRRLQEG